MLMVKLENIWDTLSQNLVHNALPQGHTHNKGHFKISFLCIPPAFLQLSVGEMNTQQRTTYYPKKITTLMAGVKKRDSCKNYLKNVICLSSSVNTYPYYCSSLQTTQTDFKFRNTQYKYDKHDLRVRNGDLTDQQTGV